MRDVRRICFPAILALGLVFTSTLAQPLAAADPSPIDITNAWARASAGPTGAVYLTLDNHGGAADRLVGVASDAAKTVELHQSIEENGIMKMRGVDGLDLPAHGQASLAPEGYHIMLIGLIRPLNAGDSVAVTLRFSKAEPVTVQVPVKAANGSSTSHHSMDGMDMGAHQHTNQ
jgi:hypothetical protein